MRKIILEKKYSKLADIVGLEEALEKINKVASIGNRNYNGVQLKVHRKRYYCDCGYIGDGKKDTVSICKNCGKSHFYNLERRKTIRGFKVEDDNKLTMSEAFILFDSSNDKYLRVEAIEDKIFTIDFDQNIDDFNKELHSMYNIMRNFIAVLDIRSFLENTKLYKDTKEAYFNSQYSFIFDRKNYRYNYQQAPMLLMILKLINFYKKGIVISDNQDNLFNLLLFNSIDFNPLTYSVDNFITEYDLPKELEDGILKHVESLDSNKLFNVSLFLKRNNKNKIHEKISFFNDLLDSVTNKDRYIKLMNYILSEGIYIKFGMFNLGKLIDLELDGGLEYFEFFIYNNHLSYLSEDALIMFIDLYRKVTKKYERELVNDKNYKIPESEFNIQVNNIKAVMNLLKDFSEDRREAFLSIITKDPLYAYSLLQRKGRLSKTETNKILEILK